MRRLEATVTINKSAKDVWEYMDNPDNMPKWLDNFVRYEHISGEMGATGSRGKHYYNERGREFVMDEEIVESRPYEYMEMNLSSKPMDMKVWNYLKSPDDNTTELRAIAEFTRVSAFMKLMMTLFMSNKKAQATHDKQIKKLKELIEAS